MLCVRSLPRVRGRRQGKAIERGTITEYTFSKERSHILSSTTDKAEQVERRYTREV